MIQHLQQKNSTDRTYSRYTHIQALVSKFVVDIKHTVLHNQNIGTLIKLGSDELNTNT